MSNFFNPIIGISTGDPNGIGIEVILKSLENKEFIKNFTPIIDEWLPKRGVELTWQQGIGGVLFLPLLVGLRGLTNYLSGYFMVCASMYAIRDLKNSIHSKKSR